MNVSLEAKIRQHEAFWRGEGPSLILIPAETQALYDLRDYPARFHDPRAMWESEMRRALPVVDWPTDGIPCVRPNLGVVWVPSMAGLAYRLPEDAMPWPGDPLSRDAIRAAKTEEIPNSETMRLAAAFYTLHHSAGTQGLTQLATEGRSLGSVPVFPYHADTQGVFDIAHLLYGEELFLDLANPDCDAWVEELMRLAAAFYTEATLYMKTLLGEPAHSMIHGHGTSQGVYFPTAGGRSSEDTVTLISPEMIERVVLPRIKATAETLGGLFVHFCGKHPTLLEQLCRVERVRAIDLGNPEYYDTRQVMELCAATGTVFHSRIAALPGEDWRAYALRLAELVRETGARVILRPLVFPEDREECEAMLDLWHERT